MNELLTSFKVLGSRINLVDIPNISLIIEQWINEYKTHKKCRQMVVTGFHGIWEAHKDPDFKAILNSADLWVPDGIAPVWIARIKGLRNADRTPGAEIMQAFFELANEKGYSSFFYGDTEETLKVLKEDLEKKYPGHRVAGTYSPPFRLLTPEEDEQAVKRINDSRPDVLWVGLGLPKQDRWVFEHKDRLNVPIAAGVGAAFLFLSGKVKRVPGWVGRSGLEWLWRFILEPKKLWRRDLIDGPQFLWHVLMELSGIRKYE
jgi:N-acetylglucosaminyldiphosphoundecaprenol N-acetyl-beta-D-mannosaminyltransferase